MYSSILTWYQPLFPGPNSAPSMTNSATSSSPSSSQINPSLENPMTFSDSQETSPLAITCHRLNGNNYLEWSQSVKIFLSGRERYWYVTREIKNPAPTAAGYSPWMQDDNQVMTWLLNSMTPDVSKNFLLYTTSATIWETVKETYSSLNNISELFRLEGQAFSLKQEGTSVTLYYHTLNSICQQLDLYENIAWVNPKDVILHKQVVSQKRIFQFLQGLHPVFHDVSGRIIGTSPLPSLREVFSTVKNEESRRILMQDPSPPPSESVLLTHIPSSIKRVDWKVKSVKDASSSNRDPSSQSAQTLVKTQMLEIQKLFEKFQGTREAHLIVAEPEVPITPSAPISPPKTVPPFKHVYRRRKQIPESLVQSFTCQELDMDSAAHMDKRDITSKPLSQNLDAFPIAIRKGTRTCTKHPINRFAGYSTLMPSFQAFIVVLDAKRVPKNTREDLQDPRWKGDVEEENSALEKFATWSITDLPLEKKSSGLQMDFCD
ncbi:hypothetical protein V6N12_046046 [Hibiscus sabdariffa]|uniref:Retrotransposon Copia-like N-terminal domain-containing protein n=1 Tax=Hibiscus sabdariffa TaxID=183260 RepID=A0ABR2G4R3_9ROSI